MGSFVYLDNSNLWIEGQRISAVNKGLTLDISTSIKTGTFDTAFRVDFGRILDIANHVPVKVARFYGSRPPESDTVWGMAKQAGFKLDIRQRNYSNKEKGVDTALVAAAMNDSYSKDFEEGDVFSIFAGDNDYVPLVEMLRERAITVNILFWNHATGQNLKGIASNFLALDEYVAGIKLT